MEEKTHRRRDSQSTPEPKLPETDQTIPLSEEELQPALRHPALATAATILQLQRTIGNAATRQLVQPRQIGDSLQSSPETIRRLAQPSILIRQTGGTCGLYSLCMAIHAIDPGTWPDSRIRTLLKEIQEAALEQGTAVGEEFSVQRIVLLATRLGYDADIVPFKNEDDFAAKLKATGSKGVLVAWACAAEAGLGAEWQNALSAHWSVIASYDEVNRTLVIYNPQGRIQNLSLAEFYRWNRQLDQEGPFAFKEYAEKKVRLWQAAATGAGLSLRDYIEQRLGIPFDAETANKAREWSVSEEVAAVIVNLMSKLKVSLGKVRATGAPSAVKKLPERKVNLAGEFVTISGKGLGPGKRLPMLLERPYE